MATQSRVETLGFHLKTDSYTSITETWIACNGSIKSGPPGTVTVGESPPGVPQIGELFFDETVDKLKVYTSSGWKLAN